MKFEVCDCPSDSECHVETYHRDAWLVIFDRRLFTSPLGVGSRQGEPHGLGGLGNTPLGRRGTDPKI